jgi:quercetin dioxygenase-like cupin family protein
MSSTAPLDPFRAGVVACDLAAAVEPATVVSRTLLKTPDLRVTLFHFAAGQELTTHTSRRRALVQVVAGRGEFFFDGAWHPLAAGGLLHFPPDLPHAVRAPEAFSMLLTLGAEPAALSSQP